MKRLLWATLALLPALLVLAVLWVGFTQSGLRVVLRIAEPSLQHVATYGNVRGRLFGPLQIEDLKLTLGDVRADIASVEMDWRPRRLLLGQLDITQLSLRSPQIDLPAGAAAEEQTQPAGGGFSLPLGVNLESLAVSDGVVRRDGETLLGPLSLQLAGSLADQRVDIRTISLHAPQADLDGRFAAGFSSLSSLDADLDFDVQVADAPRLTGSLTAGGTWRQMDLTAVLSAPAQLNVQARLSRRPVAWNIDGTLTVAPLPRLDVLPATLTGARGQLTVSGRLDHAGINGEFQLPELAPGTWRISGNAGWQSGSALFDGLSIALPGSGQLLLDGRLPTEAGGETSLQASISNAAWPPGDAAPLYRLPRLDLTVNSADGRLQFQTSGQLQAASLSGPLDLSARGSVQGTREATVDDLTLSLPDQGISIEGQAQADRSPSGLNYRIDLQPNIAMQGLPPVAGALHADGDLAGLRLRQSRLDLLGGHVELQGRAGWQDALSFELQAAASDLNPGGVASAWQGSLNARLQASTQALGSSPVAVSIEGLTGQLRGRKVNGDARASFADGSYELQQLQLAVGTAKLSARGSMDDSYAVSAQLQAPALADMWPGLSGSLNADVDLSGPADALHLKGQINGKQLAYGSLSAGSLTSGFLVDLGRAQTLQADVTAMDLQGGGYQAASVQGTLSGTPARHRLDLQLQGPQSALALMADGTWQAGEGWSGHLTTLDGNIDGEQLFALRRTVPVSLQNGRLSLGETCLQGMIGELCTRLSRQPGAARAQLDLTRLDLEALSRFLDSGWVASGDVSGSVQLQRNESTFQDLRGALQLSGGGLWPSDQPERVLVSWSGGRLDLSGDKDRAAAMLDINLTDGELAGRASVAWNQTDPDLSLHAQIDTRALDAISPWVPQITQPKGHLTATVDVDGSIRAADSTASFRLSDASVRIPELGITPAELNFDATLKGRRLDLQGSGKFGDGMVNSEGYLELTDKGVRGAVRLDGKDALVADLPEAHVLASPNLALVYLGDQFRVTGRLEIPSAMISSAPGSSAVAPSSDEVIVGPSGEQSAQTALAYVDVVLVLGDDVRLAVGPLQTQVTGKVNARFEPGKAPTGRGELTTVDGDFGVFGQHLTIDQGTLTFNGGPLANPGLEVTASRQVESQKVGVQVRGTANDPVITVFSDPPLSQAETLSYLATGKPMGQLGAGESDLVASAANSAALAGGKLITGQVGRRLGLDELTLQSQGTLNTASLMIGKYLSPRLYVAYGFGLAEAANVLRFRYLINTRLSLQAQSGSEQSVDLVYSVDR